MDLAKAILLAKLAAYGIDDNLILYIHSYLSNRKQWVCINNILSEFNKVIVGVPQVLSWDPFFSIVSLVIFTTSLRMLMYITLSMTTRSLTTLAQNVRTLKEYSDETFNIFWKSPYRKN